MLSLAIQLCPSAEGHIQYSGPSCHSLEIDCSDDEICVSAWSGYGKQLPVQFKISTPLGLFEPYSTSISSSNYVRDPESRLTTDDSDRSVVGNPTNEVGRPISNGEFHPSSVNGRDCPSSECDQEDTAELASRLSALTTDHSDRSSDIGNPVQVIGGLTSLGESENSDRTLTSRLSALTTDDSDRSSDIGNPVRVIGGPTSLGENENSDGTLASRLSSLRISETSLASETRSSKRDSVGESVTGLSFHLQLSRPLGVEPNFTPPPTMPQFLKDRVKPDSPLTVSCTSCERTLSPDPIRFRRVEECCEGLSSELSEGWFCHAEAPPAERAQPLCLFFDSRCFYMHEFTLRELFGGAGWSACPACGSSLTSGGRPVQGFTPFFCDKIEFRGLDLSVPYELPYRVEAVWIELWGMIRCALETSPVCKLYLHSKGSTAAGSKETCLLLSASSSKEPFFFLQGSSEVRDQFRTEPFYRVRYLKCHQPTSKAVRSWRHDFEVDFYRVSDFAATLLSTCLEVTTIDTACPTNDGFLSAFLPASLEGARRFCV